MAEAAKSERFRMMASIDGATLDEIDRLCDLTEMERQHVIGVLVRIGASTAEAEQSWVNNVLGMRFNLPPCE